MTRGSNHGRCLQNATFRGCVACSDSTCNRPVCSLGCTARPQSLQKETTNASVRARQLPSKCSLSTWEPGLGTSQPFIKQTYNLVHLIAATGHPYKIHPINAIAVS
ncbi:hypothetical protein MTP99_002228 [Tenebrio molitor]|nr:hypothetical protein MTP99_002228 [Tenebrio molitor]